MNNLTNEQLFAIIMDPKSKGTQEYISAIKEIDKRRSQKVFHSEDFTQEQEEGSE